MALELFEDAQRADERAGEAVELGDDHAIALPGPDPLHDLVEDGTAHASAGDVELGLVPVERVPVSLCPALDLLALNLRGDEARSAASGDLRYADVGVEPEAVGCHGYAI